MQDIYTFEDELVALLGKPTFLRPFVCEDSPLDCKVFIVGFNPATESSVDFWRFWRRGLGFDKEAWYANYLEERMLRPLEPGKVRRNRVSNTRRVMEWIIKEMWPQKCLETNIHSMPTTRASGLTTACRNTDPFDYLVRKIDPCLIIAHGDKAQEHLVGRSGHACVINVKHFSRGWSKAQARELGRRVVDALAKA
jgi:hypothetical protein